MNNPHPSKTPPRNARTQRLTLTRIFQKPSAGKTGRLSRPMDAEQPRGSGILRDSPIGVWSEPTHYTNLYHPSNEKRVRIQDCFPPRVIEQWTFIVALARSRGD